MSWTQWSRDWFVLGFLPPSEPHQPIKSWGYGTVTKNWSMTTVPHYQRHRTHPRRSSTATLRQWKNTSDTNGYHQESRCGGRWVGEHCPMVTHLRIKPEDHIDAGTRRNREVTRVRNLTRLIQGSSTTIRSCQDLPLLHPKQRDTHLAYASPFYDAVDANPLGLPSTPHLCLAQVGYRFRCSSKSR